MELTFNPDYVVDLELAMTFLSKELRQGDILEPEYQVKYDILMARKDAFIKVRDMLVALIADQDSLGAYYNNSVLIENKEMIAKELGGLSGQLLYMDFMNGDYTRTDEVLENMSYCDNAGIPLMVRVIRFHLINLKTFVNA